MNILLDAYFDRNFGDDVFVKCITNKFPNDKFYAFLEYYPKEVCDWAEKLPNLYLLPECNVFLQKNMFDAYICVGGDIFPDKGDFKKRKNYVKSVKECGGIVAYLGFSLFHGYSAQTKDDICELMEQSDIIAPRDSFSVGMLQEWLPHKEIQLMADMAFSYFSQLEKKKEQKEMLGVSIRKPGKLTEETIEAYSLQLVNTINAFLEKDKRRKVKIFSLSLGIWNDTEVADRIISRVKDAARVEHFVYNGEIQECYEAMGECKVIIGTRLHSMIAAIALEKEFIPVIYEVKQEHMLQEIGYTGKSFEFHDLCGLTEYVERLWSGQGLQWEAGRLEAYCRKSHLVFRTLEELLEKGSRQILKRKADISGVNCEEKQYAKSQVEEVLKKSRELEQLAASMDDLQHILQECQSSNENYLRDLEVSNQRNGEYFSIIEEQNRNYSELERVKDEYITSLNKEKDRLDGVIVEKQQEENRLNQVIRELDGVVDNLQLRNQFLEQEQQVIRQRATLLEQEQQVVQQRVAQLQQEKELEQEKNNKLEQDNLHARKQYADSKAANDVLLEQQRALETELGKLQESIERYEEVLCKMRPYFMSGKGSFITRQMSNLLEMKEKGSKENWEKIQEFYQYTGV